MRSPRTATKSSTRSPQLENACAQQRRPNAAKKEKRKNPKSNHPKLELSVFDNRKKEQQCIYVKT